MSEENLVVGQKHCRPFDDGSEKIEVWFDMTSPYFADRVMIRPNGSDDSTIYIDFADVRWLGETLTELADVLKGRGEDA